MADEMSSKKFLMGSYVRGDQWENQQQMAGRRPEGHNQAHIYARAPGAWAQGGILKKSRLKYGMWKKAVHEREI